MHLHHSATAFSASADAPAFTLLHKPVGLRCEGAYLTNCAAVTQSAKIDPFTSMRMYMKTCLLLLALSVPALAQNDNSQGNEGGGLRGAPGPLMAAGLPVLLIGGGIYWIVRRKKRSSAVDRTPF